MLQYASVIELVFFILSMIATVFWAAQVWEALKDSAFQITNKLNGQIRTVTEIGMQQAWMKLIGGLVMLCASIFFLSAVPPPPPYSDLPASLVGVVSWIMITLRDIGESLLLKRAREYLIKNAPIEIQQTVRTLTPAGEGTVQGRVEEDKKIHDGEMPVRRIADRIVPPVASLTEQTTDAAVKETLIKIEENTAAIDENTKSEEKKLTPAKEKN